MADPREADVRAVLRAEAHRRRATGMKVAVAHTGGFGVLAVSDAVAALGADAGAVGRRDAAVGVGARSHLAGRIVTVGKTAGGGPSSGVRPPLDLEGGRLQGRLRTGMKAARVSPDFRRLAAPGWSSAFASADANHAVALAWPGDPVAVSVESVTRSSSF